jgi:4-hydroxybenzoate polyprenyltransferase
MIISLAAYCAGIVTNDIADYREDLRDRPTRPLPSGAVSRGAALALALFFIAIAVAVAALVSATLLTCTAILLAAILFYNLVGKRIVFIAPLSMGLCRGLSVLVGMVAVSISRPSWISMNVYPKGAPGHSAFSYHIDIPFDPSGIVLLPVAVIAMYIAAVSALARNETSSPRIPRLIGVLIRGLLLIQAAFCALAGGCGWLAAILLLALWPVSRLLARRYYAS